MADSGQRLDRWLQDFVAEQTQAAVVDGWVERITAPIFSGNPEVVAEAVLARDIRSAVRSHWLAFLASLLEPEREVTLVQPAVDLAAGLARRGHPSTVLFRVYRVAQQAVWEFTTTLARADAAEGIDSSEVLVFFWSRASSWLDSSIERSVEVFTAEAERVRQGTEAQRLDAVRSILGGEGSDTRELSALLGGYPISGHNTALLLHTEDTDAVADLAVAAARVAREVGVRNALIVSPGGRDLWCWLGTRSAPELSRLHSCDGWLAEHGVLVAAGTPAEGLDGFRLSHQEAQEAQAIAFLKVPPVPLTLFEEVELLTLVATSPDACDRFVARTLGELAAPGEGPERLRETLHALLSTGSVDEAAQILSVHKNTVRYRVGQAEKLLGRPVTHGATEIELALRYLDLRWRPAPPPLHP